METFIEPTSRITNINKAEEIDYNNSPAPPLLTEKPILPINLQPGTADPFNPEDNNANLNSNNNENSANRNRNRRRRRRNKNNYKASICRKIFQIFFSILLFCISFLSISFQILYGINIGLIDDLSMINKFCS